MYELKDRQEDLGLLIGSQDVASALDRAIATIWVPFWKTLPKHLCTPRNLISNKEIVFSLIESVGSSIVSEKIALEREIEHYRNDSKYQRQTLLRTVADTAQFASECSAFNISYSADEMLDESTLDTPFDDVDAEPGEDSDPMWKICVVFVNAYGQKKLTHIVTHEEYVEYFAPFATVVRHDPDPEVLTEEFSDLLGPSDRMDFPFDSSGPTLR